MSWLYAKDEGDADVDDVECEGEEGPSGEYKLGKIVEFDDDLVLSLRHLEIILLMVIFL
jgi:hypothetical protein